MKKPCSDCEYSLKYNTRKRVRYMPKMLCEQCRNCEAYKKYTEYRKDQQQYYPGNVISTVGRFEDYIKDNSFVYIHDKIYHIGWVTSLQYMTLRNYINCRVVREAIKKGNETEVKI